MSLNKQPQKKRQHRLIKLISALIKGIFLMLLIIAFWLIVVVVRPDNNPADVNEAASAYFMRQANIQTTEELFELLNQSTYDIMAYPYGMGINFDNGTISQTGKSDALIEIWSLNYTSANGVQVNVQTIYPNDSLSSLHLEGMTLTSNAAITVSGVPCARLAGHSSIVYYGKNDVALYRIEIPIGVDENAVLQSLQLITRE